MENLKEDATSIFGFMALNDLVANPSKTKFMLLNNKDNKNSKKIRVGDSEGEDETFLAIPKMDQLGGGKSLMLGGGLFVGLSKVR